MGGGFEALAMALPCNLPNRAQAIAAIGFDHCAGFHDEPRALGAKRAVRP
ncbi:MAG TPA: hypothetical protein VEY92_06105 [Pseudoxanthomonas sp.]|nr:hypothetical protein [Pseudoxanthomonas sp.]